MAAVMEPSMIAVVTSILAGEGAALLPRADGVPLVAAVTAGVGVALVAYGLHMLWVYRGGRPEIALVPLRGAGWALRQNVLCGSRVQATSW